MQANLKSLLDVLGRPGTQYVIPVFQRVYSWTEQQCEQLWNDMLQANDEKTMHFMGMLITLHEESEGTIELSSVIDGQQRLTTLTLMLVALRDALRAQGSEACVAKADEIDATYLQTSQHECKLLLSEQDRVMLEHLVLGSEAPEDPDESSFLLDNLEFFRGRMGDGETALLNLLPALEALAVIAVELEGDDAPQQVFESLNAKGKPLSTTDLIRNTLQVKFGSSGQEELFETYWTPLDDAFAQFGKEQDIYLDAALHQWIAGQRRAVRVPKRTDLYQAFKKLIDDKDENELGDMLRSISASCLAFANDPKSEEARRHIDWAIEKPQGLISQHKMFGD